MYVHVGVENLQLINFLVSCGACIAVSWLKNTPTDKFQNLFNTEFCCRTSCVKIALVCISCLLGNIEAHQKKSWPGLQPRQIINPEQTNNQTKLPPLCPPVLIRKGFKEKKAQRKYEC